MEIALVSFLGVILGAFLQYLFTKHLEDCKHIRSLRKEAYTDYLKCVADHANPTSKKSNDLASRTADAKCRVGLYATPTVIKSFADFERLGATMNTKDQMDAFTHMVMMMRKDSESPGQPLATDLQVVLLGQRKHIKSR